MKAAAPPAARTSTRAAPHSPLLPKNNYFVPFSALYTHHPPQVGLVSPAPPSTALSPAPYKNPLSGHLLLVVVVVSFFSSVSSFLLPSKLASGDGGCFLLFLIWIAYCAVEPFPASPQLQVPQPHLSEWWGCLTLLFLCYLKQLILSNDTSY